MGFYSPLNSYTSKVFVPRPRVFFLGGYETWATAYKYDRWTGFATLKQACDSILRDLSYEYRKKVIERGTSVGSEPQEDAPLFPITGKSLGRYAGYSPGAIINVEDDDPRLPRPNWFQRLLHRF